MDSFIESLESRRCRSASVHPAILSPSAVEGHYVGTATAEGISKEVKLTITSTDATLTIVGVGTRKVSLTAKEFTAIRKGSIDESGTYGLFKFTIDGRFNSSGTEITGTAKVGSGITAVTGSAVLRKVS